MSEARLEQLADELEEQGLVEDAAVLREVEAEINEIEQPPGLFTRMTSSMVDSARTQWGHAMGELQESKEVWSLLRRRVDGQPLNPEEQDMVRSQILDVFRVVPAGLITVCNSVFPVPGTTVFTPWMLKKLGLLPSRWREAHALTRLEDEHEHLVNIGAVEAAGKLKGLIEQLEVEAAAREEIARRCALLSHWDLNDNGVWDVQERKDYRAEVIRLQAVRRVSSARKCWYVQLHDHVFGPVRLRALLRVDSESPLLVSHEGTSGWISLHDLFDDSPDTDVDDP